MTATPDLRTSGFNDTIVSLRIAFDPARWFRIVNVTSGLAVDGFVKLTNRTSGLVIDGAGAPTAGGNPVQSGCTGAASQQWSITDTGGGVCVIANRASGLVLDGGGTVPSGFSAEGVVRRRQRQPPVAVLRCLRYSWAP
ncbi:RICIN domain-containing protein [Amycolatopsis sp. NPDC024027]|uniref:RICIN domain-containing protein n=1 Tax=Amycolatopsis sp. NPDC024027 TaxID=3154327 RepID=UPI0033FBB5C5